MRPADLQLDLDSFAGPFDLLCTVLLRRELPIEDVQLVEVVVAYVQNLAMQERLDAESASEFLVLVASLLEIKARHLLTVDDEMPLDEPDTAESREEMLERMLRYSTFKSAAGWLRDEGDRDRWWRVASRPVVRRRPSVAIGAFEADTLRHAMHVLLRRADVDVRHLVGSHASVAEMTTRLLQVVRERRSFGFESAVAGYSRLDQAVAFVAALELCKEGVVELHQAERFGEIELRSSERAAGAGRFVRQTVDAGEVAIA